MKPFGTSKAARRGGYVPSTWRQPLVWLTLICSGCFYEVGPIANRDQPRPPTQELTVAPVVKSDLKDAGVRPTTMEPPAPQASTPDAATTSDADAGSPSDAAVPIAPLPPRCLDVALQPKVFASSQVGPYAVRVDRGRVVWLDSTLTAGKAGALKAKLETGGAITTLATGLQKPFAFEVDETHAYLTSPTSNLVIQVRLDESAPSVEAASGQGSPHDLVVDETHIYWASLGAGKIRRVEKSTIGMPSSAPMLVANAVPRVKMLASSETTLYFTQNGGQVGKVEKDGLSPPQLLVTEEQLATLVSDVDLKSIVTYDLAVGGEFVYFRTRALRNPVPHDPGLTARVRTDGSALEIVRTDSQAGHSFLQLVDGLLYLPLSSNAGKVWRFDPLAEGAEVTVLNCQNEANPTSVAISKNWIYWANSRGATVNRTRNR